MKGKASIKLAEQLGEAKDELKIEDMILCIIDNYTDLFDHNPDHRMDMMRDILKLCEVHAGSSAVKRVARVWNAQGPSPALGMPFRKGEPR